MNDNEFKKLIKNEFDNVKAAPSAEERILRKLKGADTMEERTKANITSSAEVKKRWGAGLVAAALAVTIGAGGVIALNAGKNKASKDSSITAASSGNPLGLPEAEGREGLYKVNDNTYFCPFTYDSTEGVFKSEDGMISGEAVLEGYIDDRAVPTPSYLTTYYVKWTNRMNGREIEAADYYLGYNVQAVIDGEDICFVTDCGRGEYHTEQSGGMAGSFEQLGLVYVGAKSNPSKVTYRAVIKTTDGDTIYYGMYNDDVTAATEGYEDVSTLKLVKDEDAYTPDETPFGLPAADGRYGLYELGENNYFCPFTNTDEKTFVSEDGRITALIKDYKDAVNMDSVTVSDPNNTLFIVEYTVNMPEFSTGTFFAGVDVYAAGLLETYPAQISFSMGSDIVENGIEYRKSADDGDTVAVIARIETPEYICDSITPRVILTTENGETIQYALTYNYIQKDPAVIDTGSEESDSSESEDSSSAADSDSSEQDESSAAEKPTDDGSDTSAADSLSTDDNGVVYVNDHQVLVPLIKDGNTFTSVDGRFKAEYHTVNDVECIRWSNLTGTDQQGDFFAGSGVYPYIVDNGDGPEVNYMYSGTESGYSVLLYEFDNIEIEMPSNNNDDVSPRAVVKGSDGKDYIYALLDMIEYND